MAVTHECPRNGCTRRVGDSYLMCGPDWKRVPVPLQRAVYAAYKRGKGIGSPQLLAAQEAAIAAVNGEPEPLPKAPKPPLFGAPPPGCDAHLFGGYPSVLDGHCRCMTCGRCGHHSTNTHQGHHGGWCSVTKGMREPHFCCPDPAYGCELEAGGSPS